MKKISLVLVLVVGFLVGVVYGQNTKREDLYRQFGPMLVEAIVIITKDEINILRTQHGLPERTNQQIMNALQNKLDGLSLYPWMNEDLP